MATPKACDQLALLVGVDVKMVHQARSNAMTQRRGGLFRNPHLGLGNTSLESKPAHLQALQTGI